MVREISTKESKGGRPSASKGLWASFLSEQLREGERVKEKSRGGYEASREF